MDEPSDSIDSLDGQGSDEKETMDAGSRKADLAMAFTLPLVAENRCRRVTAPLLPSVKADAEFLDGGPAVCQSQPTPTDLLTDPISVRRT